MADQFDVLYRCLVLTGKLYHSLLIPSGILVQNRVRRRIRFLTQILHGEFLEGLGLQDAYILGLGLQIPVLKPSFCSLLSRFSFSGNCPSVMGNFYLFILLLFDFRFLLLSEEAVQRRRLLPLHLLDLFDDVHHQPSLP